jgi:hypothetical protein
VPIWLDTLSRDLPDNGGLAALIRDYGVTGAPEIHQFRQQPQTAAPLITK